MELMDAKEDEKKYKKINTCLHFHLSVKDTSCSCHIEQHSKP